MLLAASVLFAQEPEIIIELTGSPEQTTAPQDIAVWENDSSQLAKQLRGKTREQALYLITSVPRTRPCARQTAPVIAWCNMGGKADTVNCFF